MRTLSTYNHRLSKDIDIFLDDAQLLGGLSPCFNDKSENALEYDEIKPEVVNDKGQTARKHQSLYCTNMEVQFLREVLKQKRAGQNDMTLFQVFEMAFHCGSCSENTESN